MLREIKLYWRLRPYINREKELLKMKLSFNLIAQILATAIQGTTAISGMFPPKTQAAIAVCMGAVQSVVAVIAHFSQPPATEPAK
jgi:hypothetical protein